MSAPDVVRWFAHERPAGWTCPAPSTAAQEFHRSLADYQPTPLVDLPALANELGVGHVLAKDESSRLGLPAFKALGASWAVHLALGGDSAPGGRSRTVVAATDGNHGRAVARFARILGHRASIVVPRGVHPAAVQAIVDEGAQVTAVDGSYDDAVAAAERLARTDDAVLVQDTGWAGYEEIPRWIVAGYETLFAEIDDELRARRLGTPGLVVVPVGVGSLLQAAIAHYRCDRDASSTAVMSVEPEAAACVAPSLAAGHPVTVPTGETVMAGLNCGTPSSLAWPFMTGGLDAAVAVSDTDDVRAARDLTALGVRAGPCGAAGLAAARLALSGPGCDDRRAHLGVGADSCVLLLVTEGSAANPAAL
jgi:diaminopropionate ammonia-lyase